MKTAVEVAATLKKIPRTVWRCEVYGRISRAQM
jgi:hypothetical protein